MMQSLVAEFAREIWAMEPRALEAFLGRLVQSPPLSRSTIAAAVDESRPAIMSFGSPRAGWLDDDPPAERPGMSIESGVAAIHVRGVLLKRAAAQVRSWGVEATGYDELAAEIAAAVEDPRVKALDLRIESPGGQVSGAKDVADAIFAARAKKDVFASIEDIGASGAYLLASQARRVTAGENAIVGSIGVYAVYVDSSAAAERWGYKVHVVASGPHKAMGVPGAPITEEQLAPMREVIDGMAAHFAGDVARGRGRSLSQVGEWATGRVWLAPEAARLGLIDAVSPKNASSSAGGPPAALSDSDPQTGGPTMEPKTDAAADEIRTKAAKEARDAERKRLADLKAAFPQDLGFAMGQYEAGAGPLEAKAAYADVLAGRLAELEKAKPAPAPPPARAGAAPVPDGEAAAESAATWFEAEPFMAAARAYRDERKCSMREAMREIAHARPDLHRAFMDATRAHAPEIAQRKRAMGMK